MGWSRSVLGWVLLAAAGCGKPPPATHAPVSRETAVAKEADVKHQSYPWEDPRVASLLAKLSLPEKIGQLNQRTGGRSQALNSKLTDVELELVRNGHVSSYLHVAGAAPLHALQRVAIEESPHRIPLLFAMDVVHGYRTIFPVPLAAAATWDPTVVERAARIAATEATAAGLHWTFAPMVDVSRDPRWGRIVEGAGEDPLLGEVMAAAQVRGYQGDDLASGRTLLACPKHYVAYGAAVGGRDYGSANVGARELEEVYLPPFQAAFAAGAGSVMVGFNDVEGTPMTANRELLGRIDGNPLVVSDWNAIDELINHGVAASRTEAARLALEAGVHLDMMSGAYADELARVVTEHGLEAALDRAVATVLFTKFELGLFDDPFRYGSSERERDEVLTDAHRTHARTVAARSLVLLKNDDDALPLRRDLGTLAVIGPFADDAATLLGSWKAQGRADETVSIRQGIAAAVPEAKVTVATGCHPTAPDSPDADLATAERLARRADAAVLVVGEPGDWSGEARSRSTLELPGRQLELARRVVAAGRHVVVVVLGGRPLDLSWLADHAAAILLAWLPGTEGGNAIADALFGEVNPGGRLPVTFPRHVGQVPIFYAQRNTGRPASANLDQDTNRYVDLPVTPLYPFGHGLSYTSFEYRDLALAVRRSSGWQQATAPADDELEVSFSVRNTGSAAGDEVVQVYAHDPVASVARPTRQLVGFARVPVAAGTTHAVTIRVPLERLAFRGPDDIRRTEAGRYEILIGSSSADLRLRGEIDLPESIEW